MTACNHKVQVHGLLHICLQPEGHEGDHTCHYMACKHTWPVAPVRAEPVLGDDLSYAINQADDLVQRLESK